MHLLPNSKLYLMDTCSLVSLVSTGYLDRMINETHLSYAISTIVKDESKYYKIIDINGAQKKIPINITDLINKTNLQLIDILDLNPSVHNLFLNLACLIDDGEAEIGAIAREYGGVVITDDGNAISILNNNGINCCSAIDLFKYWTDLVCPDKNIIDSCVTAMKYNRIRVRPDHPLYSWWQSYPLG